MSEETLVVEREGDEPIAVAFMDVSGAEDAVIMGYVQPDGSVADEPHGYATFEAAHDAADKVEDEGEVPTGFLYTGLAFAKRCCEPASA
jgi:hypothetical protein